MDKKEYKRYSEMAANGEAKAFAHLYETIYREMYYTAYYSLKNDSDAIEAVTGAARDGFNAAARLRNESQFRVFMMRTLCARLKMFFKEYADAELDEKQPEIKRKLFTLGGIERMLLVMYTAGKFSPEEISAFSGITVGGVKKRLRKAQDKLGIINNP